MVLIKRRTASENENGLMVSVLDSGSNSPVAGPGGDIGYGLLTKCEVKMAAY